MSRSLDKAESLRRLVGWFLLAVAGCAVSLTPDPTPPLIPPPGSTTDADLFEAMVKGVREGGSYYDVTHKALINRGYPSRSIFNWRTPTLTWILASLPGASWGKGLLAVLAGSTFVLLIVELSKALGAFPAVVGGFALLGSLAWFLGEKPYLFTDTWSGILIALSMVLITRGRIVTGVFAGILALGFRELAMPYVLGSFGYAIWKRQRNEAVAWAVAMALYVVLMAWHASEVLGRLGDADQLIPGGWVRFGGIRFLLVTSQMNLFLMTAPLAATVLYLSTAILGLYRCDKELGRRAGMTLGLYLVAFSIVGAPFNFYWGLITAPLIAIGFTHGIEILPKLVDKALSKPASILEISSRVGQNT